MVNWAVVDVKPKAVAAEHALWTLKNFITHAYGYDERVPKIDEFRQWIEKEFIQSADNQPYTNDKEEKDER